MCTPQAETLNKCGILQGPILSSGSVSPTFRATDHIWLRLGLTRGRQHHALDRVSVLVRAVALLTQYETPSQLPRRQESPTHYVVISTPKHRSRCARSQTADKFLVLRLQTWAALPNKHFPLLLNPSSSSRHQSAYRTRRPTRQAHVRRNSTARETLITTEAVRASIRFTKIAPPAAPPPAAAALFRGRPQAGAGSRFSIKSPSLQTRPRPWR